MNLGKEKASQSLNKQNRNHQPVPFEELKVSFDFDFGLLFYEADGSSSGMWSTECGMILFVVQSGANRFGDFAGQLLRTFSRKVNVGG